MSSTPGPAPGGGSGSSCTRLWTPQGAPAPPPGSTGRGVRGQHGAPVLVPDQEVERALRPAFPRGDQGVQPGIPQPGQRHRAHGRGISGTAAAHLRALDLDRPAGAECGLSNFPPPCGTISHIGERRCSSQEFAAWYNDLCSLPKEIAGDEVHDLGISLIHHEGLTLGGPGHPAADRGMHHRIPRRGKRPQPVRRHPRGRHRARQGIESRRESVPRQYAELVQLRVLVPPRVRPVHRRQLGRPLPHPYVNNEAAGES